ncbi:MAG: DMT family transporter, partial [Candidatus Kapabacteria bacterium]|nr:DMT family transporter [Candidatus Kapabacteria bacterium]MDW7997294.1 DMT family transporter [Bacteroidota bacterium]
MQHSVPQWRAELVLLAVTLIWGGTFAVVKSAVVATSPFLFTGLRFLLALLLMLMLWRGAFQRWDTPTIRHGLILGTLLAGGFSLQTVGLVHTTASRSAFITGTTIVLVPFFQWLGQRRSVQPWEWAGAAAALLGLWQLSNPRFEVWNIGDLLTIASTVFWATYIVVLDSFTRPASGALQHSLRLTLLQFAVTAITGFGLHTLAVVTRFPSQGQGNIGQSSFQLLFALAYTAILASLIAMLLQTHYQRYTTPVRASLIYALEPPFASLIAWMVL